MDIIDLINIFFDWNPISGLYIWQIQKLSKRPRVDAHKISQPASGTGLSTEFAWKPRGPNPGWWEIVLSPGAGSFTLIRSDISRDADSLCSAVTVRQAMSRPAFGKGGDNFLAGYEFMVAGCLCWKRSMPGMALVPCIPATRKFLYFPASLSQKLACFSSYPTCRQPQFPSTRIFGKYRPYFSRSIKIRHYLSVFYHNANIALFNPDPGPECRWLALPCHKLTAVMAGKSVRWAAGNVGFIKSLDSQVNSQGSSRRFPDEVPARRHMHRDRDRSHDLVIERKWGCLMI